LFGFVIQIADLPVIGEALFDESYEMMDHLEIQQAKVRTIERRAFQFFSNLRILLLYNNEIESLKINIFEKCGKLEHIDFSNNRISAITPKLLENLPKLDLVHFEFNECSGWNIKSEKLRDNLKKCFENCKKFSDCELAQVNPEEHSQNGSHYFLVISLLMVAVVCVAAVAYLLYRKRINNIGFSIFV
jgi:Ran GTPase-activating protein (RanGAP) involved in mRNA processing and transport